MELEGIVQNGVIIPQGECTLPEGTKVRIQAATDSNQPTLGERMRRFAEECEQLKIDLPSDYSHNHDHYLYATPKKP